MVIGLATSYINIRMVLDTAKRVQAEREAAANAIVLDIMLADGSGLDFMREIRRCC